MLKRQPCCEGTHGHTPPRGARRAGVRDSGLGVWLADLPTDTLRRGEVLQLRLTPAAPAARGPTHVSLPVGGA